MNPEIAKKWIAALRSGDYKQTKRRLRDKEGGFCCLGVLCNLHAQANPEIAAEQKDATKYMGKAGLPPPAVVEWAAMNRPDPMVSYATLSEHNDGGASFKTIAGFIEKHMETL